MKEVPTNLINFGDFLHERLWKNCLFGCSGKSLLIKLLLMDIWLSGLFLCLWDCPHLMSHKQKDGELDWQSNNIPLSSFNEMELDQTPRFTATKCFSIVGLQVLDKGALPHFAAGWTRHRMAAWPRVRGKANISKDSQVCHPHLYHKNYARFLSLPSEILMQVLKWISSATCSCI